VLAEERERLCGLWQDSGGPAENDVATHAARGATARLTVRLPLQLGDVESDLLGQRPGIDFGQGIAVVDASKQTSLLEERVKRRTILIWVLGILALLLRALRPRNAEAEEQGSGSTAQGQVTLY